MTEATALPSSRPDYSVVVPVHNSAPTLPLLVSRLARALARHRHEIVLVNDASLDDSWRVLTRLKRGHPQLRLLNLAVNVGQHAALARGLALCRGSQVVTLDDDLQNPPEEILKLLAKLRQGNDLVYGVDRVSRHAWPRRLLSSGGRWLVRWAAPGVPLRFSSFRAVRQATLRAALRRRGVFLDQALAQASGRIAWVPVRAERRRSGRSGYSLPKLAIYGWMIVRSAWASRREPA